MSNGANVPKHRKRDRESGMLPGWRSRRDINNWKNRSQFSPEDFANAVHEAGHVVIARAFGRRVQQVSITPIGISQGRADVEALPPGIDLSDRKYRALADREAAIGMAGDLAVRKFLGRTWLKGPSDSDLILASYAAGHAGATQEDVDAHFNRLAARVGLYLDLYRVAIETLAAALLVRRELTGGEVEHLLRCSRSEEPDARPRAFHAEVPRTGDDCGQ